MAVLRKAERFPGAPDFYFFCPGCQCEHGVWTTISNYNNAKWCFNGNMDKPTFSPSIKVTIGHHPKPNEVCHSFVRDGKIQFLDDCTHDLKGTTVYLDQI